MDTLNEIEEAKAFEKWLAVYDYHMKQYNTDGVSKTGTLKYCYTYADTAALFSAWCAAKNST